VKVHRLARRGTVLVTGHSVGGAIACGPVRVVQGVEGLDQVRPGEVLVTDKTDPDWEPVMKRAAAIVTNRGGRTCHAAIVSRELGLPAVVGTGRGTAALKDGQPVTVSCAEGDVGFVYEGTLPFDVNTLDLRGLERPRTEVMMNVGNPAEAMALAQTPNDGVGLAREEFIIGSYIKVHPLALLDYEKLNDPTIKAQIDAVTVGYHRRERRPPDRRNWSKIQRRRSRRARLRRGRHAQVRQRNPTPHHGVRRPVGQRDLQGVRAGVPPGQRVATPVPHRRVDQ
jgi:pyruvate,water dikinase